MKNNPKFNRTFKVSLVAVALGLVNQAWAADIACNANGVSINNQNGGTLSQCNISPIDNKPYLSLTAIEIDQSPNTTLNNVQVSVTPAANRQYSITAVDVKDSSLNINGGKYIIDDQNKSYSAGYVFELENSTAIFSSSEIAIYSPDYENGLLEGFKLSKNSQLTLNNSNVTLNNDDSEIFTFDSDSQSAFVTVNDSTLTNNKGAIAGIISSAQNSSVQANLVFNNSTVTAEGIAGNNDLSDGNSSLSENISITANNNSKLSGLILSNNQGSTVNLTLNDSSWTAKPVFDEEDNETLQSTVSNLSLNNGVVNLEKGDNFQTLTITGNLTGSGTFNLNTNIAENKGDKIIVQGTAEGNHKIGVTNQGANVADHKLTLVETNGGNAQFSLTNANNRVDLGAYQYFLSKEGNNWVLANSQNAVNPTTPAQPTTPSVNPSNPALPNTPLLADLANAQVSLRQAQLLLVESELNGIHQRLGEVKNGEEGNVWVRNVNSREKLTALSTGESRTSGFKQNVHSVQVGADAAVSDNFRLGGFVGRSQANVDFNGNYGDGKVRSNSVGLYATYLADNGIYVDNIVKYSRLKAESDHSEKRHYNAYTVSSEIGKQFKLTGDWTITPQAQLAWTHIQGKDNEDSLSSVYSRAGVRVAKGFALASGWNLQPYAEVNAITSRNNSSKVHYSNAALNVEDSRGRFESAVGLNAGMANHRIGLEVSRTDGSRYDKPYQIQAVYRYQW